MKRAQEVLDITKEAEMRRILGMTTKAAGEGKVELDYSTKINLKDTLETLILEGFTVYLDCHYRNTIGNNYWYIRWDK